MSIEAYVKQHGIGATCTALQDRLDYLKERPVVTTPTNVTDNDELTTPAPHWSTVPEKLQALKINLEKDAEQLGILPDDILTEAEKEVGPWTNFEAGRDALAKVRSVWREKIAQKATSSDNSEASQPTGQDEPQAPAQTPVVSEEPAIEAPKTKQPKSNGKPSFKKATPKNSKLRLAIGGVPGGGKTRTALQIARTMLPDGKIAVIDTESGSASKYAKLYDFDVLELANYTPESYIEAIHLAESEGYDLVITDSLSHEWDSETGILSIVDNLKKKYKTKDGSPDTWACWREASPRHQALIETILNSKIHVIATMRCKWDIVKERDENRRVVTKKVIGSLVQREKIEYEFDIVVKADELHNLIVDKSRCPELDGWSGSGIKAGNEIAERIADWLVA